MLVVRVSRCCCTVHTLLMCEDIKIPYQAHYKAFITLTALKQNFLVLRATFDILINKVLLQT